MPVEQPVIKAMPLFIKPSCARLIDVSEACMRSRMVARPDTTPDSASPRDELELDDQGQVVREGIAVECVNPAEFEVVTEEQMVEGLGWLPGRKGGGRGGLGEDGFLKQSQFRVFLDVEVAG